jgi:hypothetical protein
LKILCFYWSTNTWFSQNKILLIWESLSSRMLSDCSGADPGFQVRGGTLKKIVPRQGRCENCWGISCEKSQFYA